VKVESGKKGWEGGREEERGDKARRGKGQERDALEGEGRRKGRKGVAAVYKGMRRRERGGGGGLVQ
jgi:hypothetical protein